MIVVDTLGIKKQRKAYDKNINNLEQIYEMYYKTIKFYTPAWVDGELIQNHTLKSKYTHNVLDILKQFHMQSIQELHFILRQHKNNQIIKCKYCDEGFFMEIRTGEGEMTSNCRHRGFCNYTGCNEAITHYRGYCDEHLRLKYEVRELEEAKERTDAYHEEAKFYVKDLLPGNYIPKFILGLKDKNPEMICKIRLSEINEIQEIDKGQCTFTDKGQNFYYTWINAKQLEDAINYYVQSIYEQSSR